MLYARRFIHDTGRIAFPLIVSNLHILWRYCIEQVASQKSPRINSNVTVSYPRIKIPKNGHLDLTSFRWPMPSDTAVIPSDYTVGAYLFPELWVCGRLTRDCRRCRGSFPALHARFRPTPRHDCTDSRLPLSVVRKHLLRE